MSFELYWKVIGREKEMIQRFLTSDDSKQQKKDRITVLFLCDQSGEKGVFDYKEDILDAISGMNSKPWLFIDMVLPPGQIEQEISSLNIKHHFQGLVRTPFVILPSSQPNWKPTVWLLGIQEIDKKKMKCLRQALIRYDIPIMILPFKEADIAGYSYSFQNQGKHGMEKTMEKWCQQANGNLHTVQLAVSSIRNRDT